MNWTEIPASGIVDDGRVTEVWGNPLEEYAVTKHSHALEDVKLLAPIKPPMLYAAGPNYRGHVEGMAARRGTRPSYPDRPSPNYRSVHAIIGTEENIVVPADCTGAVQPEGQLAVVIGKTARKVPVSEALDYVFGYTIGNDISQRPCSRPHHVPRQELRHLEAHGSLDRNRPGSQGVPHRRAPQRRGVGGLLVGRPDLGHRHLDPRTEQLRDTLTRGMSFGWALRAPTATCFQGIPSRWRSAG